MSTNRVEQSTDNNHLAFNRTTIIRSLITIAVLVILYLLIRRLSGVLLPFLISFVVAYMLAPIVNFFQHKCRFRSRVLSVIVTILLVLGVLTGAIAAVPIPTINRATSIYARELARAEKTLPKVNTAIPTRSVFRRPITSPTFPRIGAQAAVDIACASAVHVVLL